MGEMRGRLRYCGWDNTPWDLTTDEGQIIDLQPLIIAAIARLHGEPAKHESGADFYLIGPDPESDFDLKCAPDGRIWLDKRGEFGFSNVIAYLDTALVWLSGRLVIVTIDDDGRVEVKADPAKDVSAVQFFGGGNSCRVPDGWERSICQVGEGLATCIFLCAGADGFTCEKFSGGTARHLLGRHYRGKMNAGRIGDCRVDGRETSDRCNT